LDLSLWNRFYFQRELAPGASCGDDAGEMRCGGDGGGGDDGDDGGGGDDDGGDDDDNDDDDDDDDDDDAARHFSNVLISILAISIFATNQPHTHHLLPGDALKDVIAIALSWSNIAEATGRSAPDVIT
jgi:hypothetical protein